ncbi:LOW QUALITY PROTEIN: hypothetical protein CFOL_v3_24693, partial [Cephalotus follicularis]
MDGGTGFTSQVYELSPIFLPKEWIMEQWDKKYYITSVAGALNGSAMVAMSKGCLLDFLYPSEGIHRIVNGYRITSTAATADQAVFILSTPK